MKICAGIILYKPQADRLRDNINAVLPQSEKLFIINNAPDDYDRLLDVLGQSFITANNITWINNDYNYGIATALNQLTDLAFNAGFEWVLTLDQDSICGDDLVCKLSQAAQDNEAAAMVSPRIIEHGHIWQQGDNTRDVEEIPFCITSGALTSIEAVRSAGGFMEELFLNEVDREICIRLRRSGRRILRVNSAALDHRFGLELVHRKIFFKVYKYRNYTPFSVYYQIRNLVFMVRKYGSDYKPYPAWQLIRPFFTFAIKFIFEPQRLMRLSAFVRGYIAGLRMKL